MASKNIFEWFRGYNYTGYGTNTGSFDEFTDGLARGVATHGIADDTNNPDVANLYTSDQVGITGADIANIWKGNAGTND